MRICFPTDDPRGLDSVVFSHFGSAPGFVVVDTESQGIEELNNGDLHHVHGMCQPLKALGGLSVDAVAVGGIGMGALMKLQGMGITVYRAQAGTVGQNVSSRATPSGARGPMKSRAETYWRRTVPKAGPDRPGGRPGR